MHGKTTLDVSKETSISKIKVVNVDGHGNRRQITFALDKYSRTRLLEELLEHHEQDVG